MISLSHHTPGLFLKTPPDNQSHEVINHKVDDLREKHQRLLAILRENIFLSENDDYTSMVIANYAK
jgi:hypothetical protein